MSGFWIASPVIGIAESGWSGSNKDVHKRSGILMNFDLIDKDEVDEVAPRFSLSIT